MARMVMLLVLLSSVITTGCAHCYDWSIKPRVRNEYGGGFKLTPMTKAQCKRRDKERERQETDARVCTVLERDYHLDVCWTAEEIEEEEDARTGKLPDSRVQPSP